MAYRRSGPTRPCRVFLCYRRETAQTAITFKGIMDKDLTHEYGNVWYSNLEGVGNFILDIPYLIGEAEWVIFFVGKAFTAGFLDENEINTDCVTARELIAIEKERQKRIGQGRPLRLMTVNVDGGYFDRQCEKDLKQLFLVAGILQGDSVAAYKGLNQNPYHSVSTLPHDFIEEHVAPYCAIPTERRKPRPIPEPESPVAVHNSAPQPKELGTVLELEAVEAVSPSAYKQAVRVSPHDHNEIVVPTAEPFSAPKQTVPFLPGLSQGLVTISNAVEVVGLSITDGSRNSAELVWLENGNLLFGNYPQTAEGEHKPIEWLVLKREADRALLISRYALDAKPYHETAIATTWAECSLRGWLNGPEKGNFFQDAFTDDEKELILTADVATDQKYIWDTNLGNPTADKVFLLSIPEAYVLLLSNVARCCAPTDYAVKQGIHHNFFSILNHETDVTPNCFWWLRSPRNISSGAPCVDERGVVYENGAHVENRNIGVRPALWINL